MLLAVLTYPGHFLLTVLSIRSFLTHNAEYQSSALFILIDDISKLAWPTYVSDCTKLYKTHFPNCQIIPLSNFQKFVRFQQWDWARQQIVKLYLDTVVPGNSWFYFDGDIIFHQPVDISAVPYTNVDQFADSQNTYVKYMLQIDNVGQWVNDQQVCVSNPPWRLLQANILQKLRAHVLTQHNTELDQLHFDQIQWSWNGMSEWELIESFQTHVQKQKVTLEEWGCIPVQALRQSANPWFGTCFSFESALGLEWFEHQNIDAKYWWPVVETIK
jgi:hypothetical protein